MPARILTVMLCLLFVLPPGCASASYVPQDPCVFHTVQVDGVPHLYLNGRAYKTMITGDVYRLTAGVPKAQRFAAQAEGAASSFAVMYGGGLLMMLASPVPLFVGRDEGDIGFGRISLTGALFLAGTVLSYGSFYQLSKATALRFDAVNAYNDHVRATGRCPAREGFVPGQSAQLPPPVQPPVTLPSSSSSTSGAGR